jgi:hypothetical protein
MSESDNDALLDALFTQQAREQSAMHRLDLLRE